MLDPAFPDTATALPPPAERERLHTRRYEFGGYRRSDGLWDIEGHMTDSKTYAFQNRHRGEVQAGEALHDMWIRLTIDEELVVHDSEAATAAGPFAVCPAIAPNFKRMIGVRLGRGWRQTVRERLSGVEGCTHLMEMLLAMATVAYQSLYPVLAKKAQENPRPGKPPLIDSCHAFKSDGEIVKTQWPEHYTGE
jgi:hypothetical protein